MNQKSEAQELWEQRRRKVAEKVLDAHRKSKRQKKIDKLKGNADHWKGLQ